MCIDAARVFAPGRTKEKITGEVFMYWFRARGYSQIVYMNGMICPEVAFVRPFLVLLFKCQVLDASSNDAATQGMYGFYTIRNKYHPHDWKYIPKTCFRDVFPIPIM